MKLKLSYVDFETNQLSFFIPGSLMSQLEFSPMSLEVDIDPLYKNRKVAPNPMTCPKCHKFIMVEKLPGCFECCSPSCDNVMTKDELFKHKEKEAAQRQAVEQQTTSASTPLCSSCNKSDMMRVDPLWTCGRCGLSQ